MELVVPSTREKELAHAAEQSVVETKGVQP